jgi:hypothetical protein
VGILRIVMATDRVRAMTFTFTRPSSLYAG